MAKLSEKILVNKAPAGRRYKHLSDHFLPIQSTLLGEIAKSTQAEILSAYYNTSFLRRLLLTEGIRIPMRQAMTLRLLFGRAAPPMLADQLKELKKLKKALIKGKYATANIEIRVAAEGSLFHTKLYKLSKKSSSTIFVGSANISENGFNKNDELMVSMDGPHAAIDAYIENTWEAAHDCEKGIPPTKHPGSLRELLRDGHLYFKPTRNLGQSLDCFTGKSFEGIAPILRLKQNIEFNDPEAPIATSIFRLLGIKGYASSKKIQKSDLKSKLARNSVETSFGYWAPAAYQDIINGASGDIAGARQETLQDYQRQVARKSKDAAFVERQCDAFIASVDKILDENGADALDDVQISIVKAKLKRKIRQINDRLSNPKFIARMSEQVSGTGVPELWEDPHSMEDLFESFAEDIAYKLKTPKRQSRIIKIMAGHFDLKEDDTTNTVLAKINRYFEKKKKRWNPEFWTE